MIPESKVKTSLEVPFYKGKFQDYGAGDEKRPNVIFIEQMKYIGISRGRSSVKFNFQDDRGETYGMFAKDFDLLVKDRPVNKPIMARWAFVKRGANYGIVLIKED